jgi:radical SAM protein with 4Fe4S-binding SPASM domain
LRRILQYFAALHDLAPHPAVRCNAPEFSAVIGATGRVQPCFFIAGPADAALGTAGIGRSGLGDVLNSQAMIRLRTAIRAGERGECKTCVCSMWRDPDAFDPAGAAA